MVWIWLGLAVERGHRLDSLVGGPTLGRMRFAAPVLSSAAFWAGLAAIPVMVLAVANDLPAFVAPLPTWAGVVASSSVGFALAGPVAAAGSAVSVATARGWSASSGLRPMRGLWRRLLQCILPAWLSLLIGFGVSLALVASSSAPTSGGDQLGAIVIGVLGAASVPPLAGALVGCVVTPVVAGPLVLIGGYAVSALGLVEPTFAAFGTLSGTWIPNAIGSLDESISPALLIAPPLLLVVLVAMVLAADRRRRWARVAATLVVGAIGAGALAWPLTSVQPPGTLPRSAASLQCSGDRIELCLWPELAPERAEIADRVSDFAVVLESAQLPLPDGMTPFPTNATSLRMSPTPDETADVTAVRLGEVYTRSLACVDPTGSFPISSDAPQTVQDIVAMHRAGGMLGVALGGDPAVAAVASGWEPGTAVTPLEHLGIASPATALTAFVDWVDGLQTRCGVASAP